LKEKRHHEQRKKRHPNHYYSKKKKREGEQENQKEDMGSPTLNREKKNTKADSTPNLLRKGTNIVDSHSNQGEGRQEKT